MIHINKTKLAKSFRNNMNMYLNHMDNSLLPTIKKQVILILTNPHINDVPNCGFRDYVIDIDDGIKTGRIK